MVPAAVGNIQGVISTILSPENFARALTSTWMAYGVTKHDCIGVQGADA